MNAVHCVYAYPVIVWGYVYSFEAPTWPDRATIAQECW